MKSVSIVPENVTNMSSKPQQMTRANHRALKSMDFRDPTVRAKFGQSGMKNHQTRYNESEKNPSKEPQTKQISTPSKEKEEASVLKNLYKGVNFDKDLENAKVSLKSVEGNDNTSLKAKIALLQSIKDNLSRKIKMLSKLKNQPVRPVGSPSLFFSPSKNIFNKSIVKLLDENKELSPLFVLREKTHSKRIGSISSFHSESTNDKSVIYDENGGNLKQIISATEEAILEIKTYRNEILLELDDIKDLLIFEKKSLQDKKKILGEKTKRIELLKNEITDLSKKGIVTSRIVRNSMILNPDIRRFPYRHIQVNNQLNASRVNTSILMEFSSNLNNIWGRIFHKGRTPEKILDDLGHDEAVSNWMKK